VQVITVQVIIIGPVGRPPVSPAGTEQAGWPVTSVTNVLAIISSARAMTSSREASAARSPPSLRGAVCGSDLPVSASL
jgi:hypothetical protein